MEAVETESLAVGLPASTCVRCGEMTVPRRSACPHCGSSTLTDTVLSGKGDVYTYTLIEEAPAGFEDQVPYIVALVHLAEGPYVLARLVDADMATLFIGMPVELDTRTGDGQKERGECCAVTVRPRRSLVE